jgi:hypothetical protein
MASADCSSSYSALQATGKKRFQGGGTMLLSYTNSQLMSNADTLAAWLEGGTTGGVGGVQRLERSEGRAFSVVAGSAATPRR